MLSFNASAGPPWPSRVASRAYLDGLEIKVKRKFRDCQENYCVYDRIRFFHNPWRNPLTNNNKFPSLLQDRVLELLAALPRHVTNKQVAEATGLTQAWLSDFTNRKIINAPAGKLEALYNYLSSEPLKV